MLQKKALFLVTAENEIQPLVNFAGIFKKKYGVVSREKDLEMTRKILDRK